jgi:hypothetical protein
MNEASKLEWIQEFEYLARKRGKARALRTMVRGKNVCALCFGEMQKGELDYPDEDSCLGFFSGELVVGDGVCWWCFEGMCCPVDEYAVHGHC